MQFGKVPSATGHVFRRDGKRGPVWYAKYRLPDGRQCQRRDRARLGPARSAGRRLLHPPQGRGVAVRAARDRARATLPGARLGEVMFPEAAREWLRYVEQDRGCKPSTMRGYRNSVEGQLIPAFGAARIVEIEPGHIERWRSSLAVSPRTKNKFLVELHGIFARAMRVYGLRRNPAAEVERLRERRRVDLRCSRPRRSAPWCAPPRASRTPRST